MDQYTEIIRLAIERHQKATEALREKSGQSILSGFKMISETISRGGKILICGNGGSSADAQHFAAELIVKYKNFRRAFSAIALTTDSSILTATGNDLGFDRIFSRQLEGLGRSGDLLIALSTSGSSPNILEALKAAGTMGVGTIMLTGENGTSYKGPLDLLIDVTSAETSRIQEMHEIILHIWCEMLDVAPLA